MRIASAYTLSREGLPTGLLRSVLQLPDADRVNNRYMKASMGEFSLGPKFFSDFLFHACGELAGGGISFLYFSGRSLNGRIGKPPGAKEPVACQAD
jgi:hypothetical protein